jgi:hypothetical protein
MFIELALLLTTSIQPPTPGENAPIIVTGERIGDLRARLAACIARQCPPNEDVDASLALAEGEFLNGDYDHAEETIQDSLSRNRRHRRAYPEPVADLYRSQARVQSHRGRDLESAQSTYEILRTLRGGIPAEDHRHFTARLEIVQAELKAGNRHGVLRELGELVAEARKAGREDVARRAEMRRLQLSYAITPYGVPAKRLQELANSNDPNLAFERVSARFFLSRIYRDRGDIARSDAMLAGLPKTDSDTRTLLYAPRIRLAYAESQPSLIAGMSIDNFQDTWIDVAYWIQPDGSVDGAEIVRKGASADWADPVLTAIRGRRYTPSNDATPSYRLERYTYTAARGTRTGSRLTLHVGAPRVEYLDLTSPDEPGRPLPESGVGPEPGSNISRQTPVN